MHDETQIVDPPAPSSFAEKADETPLLIEFFECAVNPSYFPTLANRIENWLANEPEAQNIQQLEQYSVALWERLARAEISPIINDTKTTRYVSLTFDLRPLNGAHSPFSIDDFYPDDLCRLQEWAAQADIKGHERIFRIAKGENGCDYLLARGAVDRIDFYQISANLNTLVKQLICDSFNITFAELQMLEFLLKGATLQEIAAETGKSIETIRSQVKSISAKMGAPRQQDIISLVHRIQAQASAGSHDDPHWTPSEKNITLRDGRQLFYRVYGPDTGRPVLAMHNFASASHLPKMSRHAFSKHNLKWIVPARAGYGQSSVNPKEGRELIHDHVLDYNEVLQAEGARRVVIVAMGTSATLSYYFMKKFPHKTHNIFMLDVFPPVIDREAALAFRSGMYRAGALAALYSPSILKLISRFVIQRGSNIRTARDIREMSGQGGEEIDGEEEGFREYLAPNLAEIYLGRAEGAWRDCTYLNAPWGDDADDRQSNDKIYVAQHFDFPFIDQNYIENFCKRIGANFYVIPARFRKIHLQMYGFSSRLALLWDSHQRKNDHR